MIEKASDNSTQQQRIDELTARLEEADETLRAIRSGEIDAFIIQGPGGEQVYTLRGADQPYRTLVEEMRESAAILTADGDIIYCNRRLAGLLELPLEDVIGGGFDRFVSLEDRPAVLAMLASGSGKSRARLRTTAGREVDVYLSLSTSTSAQTPRRNLIVTDLSELLAAQTGRNRAEQESQAKDEFMAMLAHELRNPLSAISAAIQVMEATSPKEPSPSARARAIIARQTHHLSRLVDDLLDVGRAITGKIVLDCRTLDFAEVVRRAVAVFGERHSEREIQVSLESAWIDGDPVRLEQIVTNIVGNAVKYTPPEGAIRVSLTAEGNDAVLRVDDDGFGISSELLPHVFDLFVQGERTLDRSQGGLGIGLTLVRRLVDLHKGAVTAFSDGAGRGSTLTVRLPKTAVPNRTRPAKPAVISEDSGMSVLVIEDNRDAREMFRMMLELCGHEVLEAGDGCKGLEMLKATRPQVAVIDVGLPGLDGYEIAKRFRLEPDSDRVLLVALTGYGTPDARERSRQAGFDHHLIKPVNMEMLQGVMSRASCGGKPPDAAAPLDRAPPPAAREALDQERDQAR